jgi:hypothetical protein
MESKVYRRDQSQHLVGHNPDALDSIKRLNGMVSLDCPMFQVARLEKLADRLRNQVDIKYPFCRF